MRRPSLSTIATATLLFVVICTAAFSAEKPPSHSLSYKIWSADWQIFEEEVDSSVMHFLNYTQKKYPWTMHLTVGYGDGWEAEGKIDGPTRTTVKLLFSQDVDLPTYPDGINLDLQKGILRLAFGYFMSNIDMKNPAVFPRAEDGQATLHGPEFAGDWIRPVGESKFSTRLAVSVLPFVFWSADGGSFAGTESGMTIGFSGELELTLTTKQYYAAAGYRIYGLQPAGGPTSWRGDVDDVMVGPYLHAGLFF